MEAAGDLPEEAQDEKLDIPFGDPHAEGGQEKALERELERMTEKLEDLKKLCDSLRAENESLQRESHDIRVESHEYTTYMDKKIKKQQTMIITQHDRNMKDLEDNARDEAEMLARYDKQKGELQDIIMKKEQELAGVKQDLHDLSGLRSVRSEQEAELEVTEEAMERGLEQCEQEIRKWQANYLRSRQEFEEEAQQKVRKMQVEASQEAAVRLNIHTKKVRRENARLRGELDQLVAECKDLDVRKEELDDEESRLQSEITVQRKLDYYQHGTPVSSAKKAARDKTAESIALANFQATPLGLAKHYMKKT